MSDLLNEQIEAYKKDSALVEDIISDTINYSTRPEFKVGDYVYDHGLGGIVIEADELSNLLYPLVVEFSNEETMCYTLDGRSHLAHTVPALKLVKRTNNKTKITVSRFISTNDFKEILGAKKNLSAFLNLDPEHHWDKEVSITLEVPIVINGVINPQSRVI